MEYFFYNTDATSLSNQGRFPILIDNSFAATSGAYSFGEQLNVLAVGDVLLMYENKIGIVAIGKVLEEWNGKKHSDPIYYNREDSPFEHEYRIKVDWYLNLSDSPLSFNELTQRINYIPRGAISRITKRRSDIEILINELVSLQHTLSDDINKILERKSKPTEKVTLINDRIGQGQFRDDVLNLWNNCCAVTGSETKSAIRASHIKPWKDSTDEEKLNPRNGLPLVASLDALFDAGLISFEASGELIVSPQLSETEQMIFGVKSQSLRDKPKEETAKFLEYHRTNIFKK